MTRSVEENASRIDELREALIGTLAVLDMAQNALLATKYPEENPAKWTAICDAYDAGHRAVEGQS